MLTQISLQNYRCFRSADVRLSPLTVLVGPNSSGKSSLLSALRPLNPSGYRLEDVWQHTPDARWGVHQTFSDGGISTMLFQPRAGWLQNSVRQFSYQLLHLDINRLRDHNLVQEQHSLAADGSNLSNVFATLTRDV